MDLNQDSDSMELISDKGSGKTYVVKSEFSKLCSIVKNYVEENSEEKTFKLNIQEKELS